MSLNMWATESNPNHFKVSYVIDEILFSGESDFQKVDVVKTKGHGMMLMNDSLIMVTERDEFIYHDMIAHVPLFAHPNPKRVLVIGGGDGGTAREVLRHKSVEKVVMVEIDKMVVDACLAHIPQTSCELSNSKLELIIGDGVEYVKNAQHNKEKFDVILVDSTDPIGPAQPLFGPEFYNDIYNCLSEDGIVVSQGESPFYERPMQNTLMKIISGIFPVTRIYNFTNMSYPGGLWSFTFGSKKETPTSAFSKERVLKSGLKFRYYTEDLHAAAFSIPAFMRDELKDFIK